MRMPEALLSENTRVIISISTLLLVIGFAITATFTFTTWKTQVEEAIKSDDARLTQLESNQIKDKALIIEVEKGMAEIKTDLKWIRAFMESNK